MKVAQKQEDLFLLDGVKLILAHGRSIGNIFQRTSSNNMSGKGAGALPYSIGSIKAGGCCHPLMLEQLIKFLILLFNLK